MRNERALELLKSGSSDVNLSFIKHTDERGEREGGLPVMSKGDSLEEASNHRSFSDHHRYAGSRTVVRSRIRQRQHRQRDKSGR